MKIPVVGSYIPLQLEDTRR